MAQQMRSEQAANIESRTGDPFTILPSRLALELLKSQRELAGVWVDLTGEQMKHNLETLRQLAEIRDWQEAINIQTGFVRDSFARLTRSISGYLDQRSDAVADLLETSERHERIA